MSSIIITLTLLGHFAPLSTPTSTVAVKKPSATAKKAAVVKKTSPAPSKATAKKKTSAAPSKAAVVKKPSAAPSKAAAVKKPSATAKKAAVARKVTPLVKKTSPTPATIALKRQKPASRVIRGTVKTAKASSPVHLAHVPATPKAVTLKAADKRKVRTVKTRQPRTVAYPPIGIYQIHLREFASIRVYDENGYLRPQALAEFNKINRCLKTGVVLEMDYRVLVELYEAWVAFGMPSVTLFSGCRQAPYASENSRHNFGTAIDYNFDGVTRRELVSWLLSRRDRKPHGVGLGYYPNSYHIHMDVREAHAFWVDLGPAGEKGSRMVADSYHWFATERSQRSRVAEASDKDPKPEEAALNAPSEEPETSAAQ
ncbi:MAG: hypothetical protein CVU59_08320 [Deltaproteobacteria bacterium HGW-Deltaproteobacteria-17]|nr:MAG: hypothetical protein CVU59_08320 [Deltaproteobacteria bacterium HGW-Deltaproteobacteria-17]